MTRFCGTHAVALAAGLLIAGCAGLAPQPPVPVVLDASEPGPALETLRPSLRSLEDSLVLDLLIGYREIARGGGDREALSRARAAWNRLESLIRRGGAKPRGDEERVLAFPEGSRATLREVVAQMSRALLANAPGEPWRPEAERAREIQRRRIELSSLIEDAEWVLALSAALESSLPEADKRKLRRLHETYAAAAPHGEVASQAQSLLPGLQDERLRREVKKLANRSWERERHARAAPPEPPPAPPRALPAAPLPGFGASPVPSPGSGAGESVPKSALEKPADNPADTSATPERTPERYCAERRAEAAQAFAAARGGADDSTRTRFLRQSLDLLDDCLKRHPDSPEAEKARQNRARVEQELKR